MYGVRAPEGLYPLRVGGNDWACALYQIPDTTYTTSQSPERRHPRLSAARRAEQNNHRHPIQKKSTHTRTRVFHQQAGFEMGKTKVAPGGTTPYSTPVPVVRTTESLFLLELGRM